MAVSHGEGNMRVLWFILEVCKPFWRYILGATIAIIIIDIDANVRPYLIKLLVDNISGSNSYNIWSLAIFFSICQFIMISTWSFSDWLSAKYYTRFRVYANNIVAQKISHYSYSFFHNNMAGSIVAKINDIFNLVPSITFTIIDQFIHFGMMTIITLALLSQIHVYFAIGLLLWICIFLFLTFIGIRINSPLTKDYSESRSILFGHLSDFITNIFNVKLFTNSKYEFSRIDYQSEVLVYKAQRVGYFLAKFYFLQGIIVSIYTVCFLRFLIILHNEGSITPGDFTLVFMLNFRISDKLFDLSHRLRDFTSNWAAVDQALKIFDTLVDVQDRPNAANLKCDRGQITFDKVKFHYKGTDPLFHNKSIEIAPGQKVGLVGYSGGGKSTFVNLILRLYDVTEGAIRIDGQDIREITQDSLRDNIAMIPQDPSLFHRSLMENIRYGRIDATDEEVRDAAKKAHAHEFIEKLPEGYDSLVGERGVKLSGGQRQRVAIARAFLKNAPILILDEATSQLDSVTESLIQESLLELMQGKTTIVIAHRLSTLLYMDRILVFEQGKIVEDGTHKELLTKEGLYKTLWDAQVGGFLPDKKKE
jgi:ATP-binding cassette subfamily B protein